MLTTAVRESPARYTTARIQSTSLPSNERPAPSDLPLPGDQQPATSDVSRPATPHPRPTNPNPRSALTEATLVRLWAGQRFPASALVTRRGLPLRVLHPGRRGRGAGPDFRDALIAPPSGPLLRGDVELHVRASDFRAHGHHRDPRYDGVVLHVVFESDAGEETRLANGRLAPIVALAPWLERRSRELEGWLAQPGLWGEPCLQAVDRLGREAVLQTLAELGERRFREREAALAAAVGREGPGAALYRALLAALEYGGLRGTLVGVADAVPWRELGRAMAAARPDDGPLAIEALVLGAAGLLMRQQGDLPEHVYERRLEEVWRGAGAPLMDAPPLALVNRPANHPARRLAGLAGLLAGRASDIEAGVIAGLDGRPSLLVARWTVPASGYWQERLAPGVASKRPAGALIGRSRAIELLVNAVLPWAAALAETNGDREGAERVREAFARLPRPGPYGALRFLEENLGDGGRPLPVDARRQQGLLALYKGECTQGGCGRCPLS